MQDAIIEALRRGATTEALEAARTWTQEAPADAQAHRWLAVARSQSGDHAAALESIDQAIALAPDDAELHMVRGRLLLGVRRPDDAQAALAKATGLDPNQLGAYLLHAQMALSKGDFDETERMLKLAARVSPDHPQLAAIEGMMAHRRGHPETAVKLLNAAVARAPDEPQLYYALGFAYLAQGHVAFAEQSFAKVLELLPSAHGLRGLIAELMLRQARPDEALETLRPMLDRPDAEFGLRRLAGVLEMAAGRPDRALPWLRAAFAEQPRDTDVLGALVDAWDQLGQAGAAREALDEALAAHPDLPHVWESRLAFTPREDGRAVIDRWLAAMPDHPAALEALATLQELAGDADGAIATTRRVLEIEPGRPGSELRLASLERREDPSAAIARLQRLIRQEGSPEMRRQALAHLGIAQDKAGRVDDAVETWAELHAERLPHALPRPPRVAALGEWPPIGEAPTGAHPAALLWGAPGACADQLAEQAARAQLPILRDRFGDQPPRDPLQLPDTAAQLASGALAPEVVVAQWRQALPRRGVDDGPVVDWIPWWDNALLLALRPHLPGGLLLVALRDPRDMLLDWLAFGGVVPLAVESPLAAAGWLAGALDAIATLHEQDLYPHRLVRLDDAIEDPAALTDALNVALDIDLPPPPPTLPSTMPRLPAGRWRSYAGPLGEAFASLSAVSRRLGYPAA